MQPPFPGYDLAVDYTQPPPPPPLSQEDAAWLDKQLRRPGYGGRELTDDEGSR